MWKTQWQTDTWINLGGAGVTPDEWVRVSEIQRVRMVEGAKLAVAVLRSGERISTAYTAQQIMKIIAGSNQEQK